MTEEGGRRWYSAGILLGGISAVVAAAVAIIVPFVINRIGDAVGGKTDVTVSLDVGVIDVPSDSNREPPAYVFPDQTIENIPVPEATGPAPYSCSDIERSWVQANGGYEAQSTWARLTIFARTSPVVIQNFELVPVAVARAPATALIVTNPCGGSIEAPFLSANLDQSHLSFEPPSGPDDEAHRMAADLNPYGRRIAPGDSYSLSIHATATEAVYTWKLRVLVLVDGVPQSIDAEAKALNAVVRTGAQPLEAKEIRLDWETHQWIPVP